MCAKLELMDAQKPAHLPGDHIIGTYLPHATAEEREEARENMKRLARVLVRIDMRRAREWGEAQIRESGKSGLDFQ